MRGGGSGFVHSGVSKASRIPVATFRTTCLMRRCKGDSAGSLEVYGDRTRVDGHMIEYREFQLGTWERKTTMRRLRCWNGAQRVCGISIPGDTRISTKGGPEQPFLIWNLLGVGGCSGDLWRSLPTYIVLWYTEQQWLHRLGKKTCNRLQWNLWVTTALPMADTKWEEHPIRKGEVNRGLVC